MCVETVTTRGRYYRPFAKDLLICSLLHLFSRSLSTCLDIPVPKDYPFPARSLLCFPQPAAKSLAGPPHLRKL